MNHSWNRTATAAVLCILILLPGCSPSPPAAAPGAAPVAVETLSRTEFTGRVENYFEYEPLHAGKNSAFLIHLTDLSDGSPVEKAEVAVAAREKDSQRIAVEAAARMGKKGIYIAELNIPRPGAYDIEFHIKNDKLDERVLSSDFKVE